MRTPNRDADPLEGAMAGSKSLGSVEQSPGEGCRLRGEADGGDVRQDIVVGNACGGKPAAVEARRYC